MIQAPVAITTPRAPEAKDFSVPRVRHHHMIGLCRRTGVFDADHRRVQPQAERLAWPVERVEVDAAVDDFAKLVSAWDSSPR